MSASTIFLTTETSHYRVGAATSDGVAAPGLAVDVCRLVQCYTASWDELGREALRQSKMSWDDIDMHDTIVIDWQRVWTCFLCADLCAEATPTALYNLALLYYGGLDACERDETKALIYSQRAARTFDVDASTGRYVGGYRAKERVCAACSDTHQTVQEACKSRASSSATGPVAARGSVSGVGRVISLASGARVHCGRGRVPCQPKEVVARGDGVPSAPLPLVARAAVLWTRYPIDD